MLVKNWMSRNLITVGPDESIVGATDLLKKHKIRMLPVIDKEKLVGMVTDRDLKRASASDATSLEIHELMYLVSKIKVKDVMSTKVITLPEDFTVEEAAEVLLGNKISGAPVVDRNDKLVGVITQTDLFRVLISVGGIGKGGIQFAFLLEDRPGSIKEVADVIRKYGGRMASIMTSYEGAPEGFRKSYIRMYGVDRFKIRDLERELKEKARLLYIVDHREERREIFE
ncbi:MAG: CBS and ACT domain-containing protein [Desulfobacteraceae bacterium]